MAMMEFRPWERRFLAAQKVVVSWGFWILYQIREMDWVLMGQKRGVQWF